MLESPTSGGGAYGPALKKATAQRTAGMPKSTAKSSSLAAELALDLIPGARFVANTVETVKGNKVSTGDMQAGYIGMLPLGGAIKAAQSAKVLAPLAASTITPAGKIAAATIGKYGKDAEQAAEVATAAVTLKRPKIAVNIRQSTLSDMLKQGNLEYKNMFDPAISGDKRNLIRREGESMTMGIPLEASAAERPNYGYLVGKEIPAVPYRNAEDLKEITRLFTPATSLYGDTAMVLKNNVNKRASFTYGDSLGNSYTPGFKPAPLTNVAENLDAAGRGALIESLGGYPRQPYLEAQIFGGINVAKDVKKFVTQYRAQVPELQKAVKDAGLNIKVSSIEKAADNPTLAASKKLFAQMAAALKKKPELKTQQTLISPEG